MQPKDRLLPQRNHLLRNWLPLRHRHPIRQKAARFAADNGFPPTVKVYGSYNSVLDDPDVDVYVQLPSSLHVCWAMAAPSKGKHLLLEKPVTLNFAELDQIVVACESSGKMTTVVVGL